MTALAALQQRAVSQASLPIQLAISRDDLPSLGQRLGWRAGAEIGVWKGAYSAKFCRAMPDLQWLCVDPWKSYPAWLDTKNSLPFPEAKALIQAAYQTARARLRPYRYCTLVRAFSTEAARAVPRRSLDFVYIDANHTCEAVTADLEAWAPRVKPGGILAGHDYRAFTDKPTIHVIEAVQAYTRTHQIAPWFITTDRTPSWLWVVA